MRLSTPVAFFVFNRPELTERVFAAIASARPERLLIAADGPRHPGEAERCAEVRRIVERVDWPCEVSRDYSETNLGCALRESSAVDWVFGQVDEAIFLEDDTLPDPSFFMFASELLAWYRDDERVMHIGGCNFQPPERSAPYSYYFSRYAHGWGWASWRRAWKHYDFDLRRWPEFRDAGLLSALIRDPAELRFWARIFDENHLDPVSYDYQWYFAIWSQGGLSIVPSVNLVSNLGFGPDATHTRVKVPWAGLETRGIDELRHPPFVLADAAADRYTFLNVMSGRYRQEHRLRRGLLVRMPPSLRDALLRVWFAVKRDGGSPP